MFKQSLAALVALLGLDGAATAQTAAAQASAAACGTPSLADKVDLKQVPGSNLMTVPVAIDGTSKQFLLDVGANPDEISQATATELHLSQIDRRAATEALVDTDSYFRFQAPVFDVMGTNMARNYQSRVLVTAFTMGGATLHGLQFLISNDRDMGKSKPYDGLLTASGFRHYDMDFDFGGKTLSFLAPTACADPNQIVRWPHAALAVIPMTVSNGKMTIPVTIGGHEIDAVIDTGSDRTVMRRGIAEHVFGLQADTPDMTRYADVRDGVGERVYQHTFPQMTFEGVVASNVPALIEANSMVHQIRGTPVTGSRLQSAENSGPPIPDLMLGMDVLHQLHIYAAFGQNKLYVTPAG